MIAPFVPLCSILLPSWKRIQRCETCIRSIVDACDNPSQIEICLRLQTDDPESIAHIPEFLKLAPFIRVMIGLPYRGYRDNNLHFQDAADIARGKWVWIMNDDCTVNGKGWDTRLALVEPDRMLAPSVHRLGCSHYYNDTGCGAFFCPNKAWEKYGMKAIPHPPDHYIRQILWDNGLVTEILEVEFHHHRDTDIERDAHYAGQ